MNVAPAYLLNPHAAPMFLMGIIIVGLGFLVYRADSKSLAHQHFFMLCASSSLWLIGTSVGMSTTAPEYAVVWFKIDNVGVVYISVAFYAFSSEFLRLQRRRSIWLGYGLATLLAITALASQSFVAGAYHYWWGYFPKYGSGSWPFFLLFTSYMAAAFIAYVRAYRTLTTPIKRQQVKFVHIAFGIAYLASIDFLPAFGYEIYPFGYALVFLLAVVISIAILRYQLLDAALLASMSTAYLPPIPFALTLVFLSDRLNELPPTTLTTILVLLTIVFTTFYVTIQPRLQSALNKALFPSRYDAYNTLTRFNQTMVTNHDLTSLQNEILTMLKGVMKIEKISLFLLDSAEGHYTTRVSHGLDEAVLKTMSFTSHDVFANFLLEKNRPLVREELEQESLVHHEGGARTIHEVLSKMGSEVCLPLVNKVRLIGFVNLGHKPLLEFYSKDELSLLESLARSAAIALDNAMLYEEWKRSQLALRRADRLRSLETIAGGFAHEIRNPLTSIKTFIQLAPLRRDDAEFMDSFGAVVTDDLARIERLIEEILDYARYMKPKFSLESMNDIVTACLQFLEVKTNNLSISIEKQLTDQLPPTLVDRQQIKQVLMNLILNAIDAMKTTGGWLTVTTRQLTRLDGSRWIQVQVADTGCGIKPEDLTHIFDPFFTTKHESTERVGTGLGLSIVHQIIQEHAGTIEAQSTLGRGTVFTVTLPEKTSMESTQASTSPVGPGKLLPFPTLPPLLQRPTGTHGP